jgi:glutamate receptor, anionic
VTAEFFVSRELTHHILQTYVPTTLIVVISWFSFWLDVEVGYGSKVNLDIDEE